MPPTQHQWDDDKYTDHPTKFRVFEDDRGWWLDAIDDDGNYTEVLFGSYGSKEEALRARYDFTQEFFPHLSRDTTPVVNLGLHQQAEF